MPATSAPRYHTVVTAGVSFQAVEGLDPSFVHWAWMDAWAHRTQDGHMERPLPPELGRGSCYLKLFPRGSGQGRARREGEGYRAFAEAGIPTPQLILYGEHRLLGMQRLGLLVTRKVEAPTVAAHFREHGDAAVFDGAAEALGRVHAAGLSHGDASCDHVLVGEEESIPFDLARWGRADDGARTDDLTRFLGSVIALTGGTDACAPLVERYAAGGPTPPHDAAELTRRARAGS